jgi:hypothetical protein
LSQNLSLAWADRRNKKPARSLERASHPVHPPKRASGDYIAFGLALAIGFLAVLAAGFFAGAFLAGALAIVGAGDAAIAGAAEMMNALAQSAIRIRFI